MTALRKVDLSANLFTGAIPAELGFLSNLQELVIARNFLTGAIPTDFGILPGLRILDVSGNVDIVGTVPTELGQVLTLENVQLGNTALTGVMPPEVCAIAANPDLNLDILVCDCGGDPPEIVCEVPACCSSCTPPPL